MPTVTVERILQAPIGRAFELISDHAHYSRFEAVQRSELLRRGRDEKNGVGALRWAYSRPFWFEEEVLVFERPTRMDYVIRRTNAPLRHEGASMVLEESGPGTRVVWTTAVQLTTPLMGRLAGPATAAALRSRLESVLVDVQRLAGL